MINNNFKQYLPLSEFITEYSERNTENKYSPVAVGKYGIRSRESIYSKELASDYSKNKLIYKNTLTVGMGSKQIDVGVLIDDVTYSVSPAYHTYKVSNINSKYLDFCIQCRNQDMFTRFVKRGSRQGKTVDLKRWLTYEIPVYDEASQAEIVDHLNRAQSLIELRQKQLGKLDDLIKARFVEMFGDLANLKCSWEKCKLIEACADKDDIKCGPFGTQLSKDEYTDMGVAVWEIPQINSAFIMKPVHFLTEKKAEELNAYTIISGDIAMSRKGNVGKCAVFPDDYPDGIIHSDVLRIRVDSKKVNSIFMMCQLHYSREVTRQIKMVSSGAIMAGINVTKLKQIYVHIPPMELQNQFADFVHQVDKSKFMNINIIREGGFYNGDKFYIS